MRRALLAAVLGWAAASCSDASARRLAEPTVDTLANGALAVMNDAPALWADTNGWKLVERYRVRGSIGDSIVLNNPQSVALDDAGRVYVMDQDPAIIKQFGTDGRLIRSIGRDGGGPGEFRVGFLTVTGSNLVVHDPRQSRTSVFDTSGTFLHSWASLCCYWTSINSDPGGHVLIPGISPPDSGNLYVRYAVEDGSADTLYLAPTPRDNEKTWTFKNGNRSTMMMSVPFSPQTVQRTSSDGGFLMGYSGGYSIVKSRGGRDTQMVFGRKWTPVAISSERKDAIIDSTVRNVTSMVKEDEARRIMKAGDIPGTAPAFTGFGADGAGNVWVQVDPGDDRNHTRFDVFDSTGTWLGQVAAPAGIINYRMAWHNGQLATWLEDDDGLPMVVVYDVKTGEN